MNEQEETSAEQKVFEQLNITKILVGILEVQKEVSVPLSVLSSAASQDNDLQVDYNSDNQTFTFKIRDKNEQRDNNN